MKNNERLNYVCHFASVLSYMGRFVEGTGGWGVWRRRRIWLGGCLPTLYTIWLIYWLYRMGVSGVYLFSFHNLSFVNPMLYHDCVLKHGYKRFDPLLIQFPIAVIFLFMYFREIKAYIRIKVNDLWPKCWLLFPKSIMVWQSFKKLVKAFLVMPNQIPGRCFSQISIPSVLIRQ